MSRFALLRPGSPSLHSKSQLLRPTTGTMVFFKAIFALYFATIALAVPFDEPVGGEGSPLSTSCETP